MTGIGVIVLAGSVCGVLDLISASALFRLKGGTFERLLQFIASGAFGESAFKGGKRSAGVGFLFHLNADSRSEEHTSELQSHLNLVCRLLLEKKKQPEQRSTVMQRRAQEC